MASCFIEGCFELVTAKLSARNEVGKDDGEEEQQMEEGAVAARLSGRPKKAVSSEFALLQCLHRAASTRQPLTLEGEPEPLRLMNCGLRDGQEKCRPTTGSPPSKRTELCERGKVKIAMQEMEGADEWLEGSGGRDGSEVLCLEHGTAFMVTLSVTASWQRVASGWPSVARSTFRLNSLRTGSFTLTTNDSVSS